METDIPFKITAEEKRKQKYANKLAFSKFVKSKQIAESDLNSGPSWQAWKCCRTDFTDLKDINCHVASQHKININKMADDILEHGSEDAKWSILKKIRKHENENSDDSDLPKDIGSEEEFPWLPKWENNENCNNSKGRILLYYKYRHLKNTEHVLSWQKELCRRLKLTGKIRVAEEGLNGTVGGTISATDAYISAVMSHPLFNDMEKEDFKCSDGDASHFSGGLKVGCFKEAVPMGIDPKILAFDEEGGKHLTAEEFHTAADKFNSDLESREDTLFLDCRNFYESRIGKFEGSLAPDIRKFSYFPEYVDQNLELFRNKSVYMYCTGGIRCERGSVYLHKKGVCKDIFQLKGGIHKYIEKFPDGFFKGKMFVFDDRYAIPANSDVISKCTYCQEPWDLYQPCTSTHCHQLVLSCAACRTQGLSACCVSCQDSHDKGVYREECDCTQNRLRIPDDASNVSSTKNNVS